LTDGDCGGLAFEKDSVENHMEVPLLAPMERCGVTT